MKRDGKREDATLTKRSRVIVRRAPARPGCGTTSPQRQGTAKDLESKIDTERGAGRAGLWPGARSLVCG